MQKAGKIVFAVDKGSFNHADHAGVNIKVNSQIKQMEKAGFEAELLQYEWKDGYAQIHPDAADPHCSSVLSGAHAAAGRIHGRRVLCGSAGEDRAGADLRRGTCAHADYSAD